MHCSRRDGGRFRPTAVVTGAYQAATEDGVSILLVGDQEVIESKLESLGGKPGSIGIVHASEVVDMDEPAIHADSAKKRFVDSYLWRACQGGASPSLGHRAGNTGATFIVAKMVIGAIEGVDRPALAAVLPNSRGRDRAARCGRQYR